VDRITPIMVKRSSFEHESEVRLLLRTEREEILVKGQGEVVQVDIKSLIERIVASPDYPAWGIASLQKLVTAAGLDVKVESSDLLRLPAEAL
jgi:hypothetical protein